MTSSTPPPSEGSPSAAAPTRCTNCGAVLQGPWCSTCGQKVSSLDPTWHDLIHDAIHEFLHLDGKIFRSARTLFCEPGELTAELLRGRRARYIGPLRLYLTFSVMFFLLTAIVPNPNPDQELASGAPRAAQEVARANYVAETFAGLAPKLVFILVPVFALLLKLAYWRHRRHYPQFLYFALHFHAAGFGFLAITVPLQALRSELWLQGARACVMAAAFGYLFAGLKRVFGGNPKRTLLKAFAVAVSYVAVLITATVGLIVVLLH